MQSRRVNTFEDIQQYYFDHATSLVAHSISVMIIALNEEYNFGTERLNRLLARYQKINRHLNDYQDDAKSQAEIRTKLHNMGLQEFADYMLGMHTIQKYRQEIKNINKVSLQEAAEAQKMLQKMKALM